jgi:hypothetical protein
MNAFGTAILKNILADGGPQLAIPYVHVIAGIAFSDGGRFPRRDGYPDGGKR